jgi:hypothetical protein
VKAGKPFPVQSYGICHVFLKELNPESVAGLNSYPNSMAETDLKPDVI